MENSNDFIERFKKTYGGKTKLKIAQKANSKPLSFSKEKGGWQICANGDLEGAFALAQLNLFEKGKGELELEGEYLEKFPDRILWPSGEVVFSLDENWSLALPKALCEEASEFLCRLVEMGYTSLVLGVREEGVLLQEPAEKKLLPLLEEIKKRGIGVIVKPSFKGKCTSLKDYYEKVLPSLSRLSSKMFPGHSVFFESLSLPGLFENRQELRDLTFQDMVLKELETLHVEGLLYFALNQESMNTSWVHAALREAGPKTRLVFNAETKTGAPNPIWKELYQKSTLSNTPLLPIVNTGNLNRGEGLWPLIDFNEWELTLENIDPAHFPGGISLCGKIPARGSNLDALLWMFASALYGFGSMRKLFEAHRKAFYPLWPEEAFDAMREMGKMRREVNLLDLYVTEGRRPEEIRPLAEGLLGRLSWRQTQFPVEETSDPKNFNLNLSCAIRDMKRHVFSLLQKGGITMPSVLNGEDLKPSFWTVVEQSPGKGIGSGAKVSVLDQPQKPEDAPQLLEIYLENRTLTMDKSR